MKRKDLFQLVAPLSDKLYRFAYALIPDDLQAEQLVIDSLNAYLIKEQKQLLKREFDPKNKKDAQVLRRGHFKCLLKYLSDIGLRRAGQLTEHLKDMRPAGYAEFYGLEPKVRIVMSLRYDARFSVEEIGEILAIPRYEVIEKIHNGRFLLLGTLTPGATA
jgi:DNA-directed RNA polymerase specialized sigma24 family protein